MKRRAPLINWAKGFSNASFVWGFINTNYNEGKVSDLLNKLESKLFKLTNDDLYKSVVFLRDSGSSQCGMKAALHEHTK
uniref:Uncharacterized protein n=1 Tax=Globodera rostochiensis TaxID=31243 RepID=A0A914ID43_GLORO